ncbi:DUF6597 domain-containing transcriptional factor [Goodfellowiella coeruleoviolacea]|uniref:DUF6597 domain-containing transcriptional factor n=1 Tax=Goodfellowiella coeruleoviolacea TaxID=334858 RepID=UPI0020A57719|nr:helix-turn-helix domain-containing protein [Goodfellowiella coeruleoviolacea]
MIGSTRGILHPRLAGAKFQLSRHLPAPALAAFVAHYWMVRWDLRGGEPHQQRLLTHPVVQVVFGDGPPRVVGVVRGGFSRRLTDRGLAVGVRFRPGGFRPFLRAPVSTITDRTLDLAEVFPVDGAILQAAVLSAGADAAVARVLDEFLLLSPPEPDPVVDLVAEVVDLAARDQGIVRVDALAGRFDVSVRRLQRLFAEYVGVSPKWVIRRCRLHEAAERAARGDDVDWSGLAAELGYADQAHLVRDFTEAVGVPPGRYARDASA